MAIRTASINVNGLLNNRTCFEDHGSPNEGVEPVGSTPDGKGLESPDTVSIQWADNEVSPMDIGSLHLDEEGFRGGSPQKTETRRTRPAHLPACGSTFPSGPVSDKIDKL